MEHLTFRNAQSVDEGFRGPFGRWLLKYLDEEVRSSLMNGAKLQPGSVSEFFEREHLIAKGNTLQELLDALPTVVKDQLNNAVKETDSQ